MSWKKVINFTPQRDQVHCMPGNLISDKNRLAINYLSHLSGNSNRTREETYRNNNKLTLNNIILSLFRYDTMNNKNNKFQSNPSSIVFYQVLVLSFRVYTGERVLLPVMCCMTDNKYAINNNRGRQNHSRNTYNS